MKNRVMLSFTANTEQGRELSALAYRIADIEYMKERHGEEDARHELRESRRTLEDCIFPRLDKLNVPFWVQNSVIYICHENWRNYANGSYKDYLQTRNIKF